MTELSPIPPSNENDSQLKDLSTEGLAVIAKDCLNAFILSKILDIAIDRAMENPYDDAAQELAVLAQERQKQVLKDDITFDLLAVMYDMPSAPGH